MCVNFETQHQVEEEMLLMSRPGNHEISVLLSAIAKLPLTLVGLGFYSQSSCSQLGLICCNIKQKYPVKHLFLSPKPSFLPGCA